MAPNMFHIGVQEKVSVTVFDAPQPVTVKLYLQDYPHRQKTFSEVQGVVTNGNLTLINRKKWFFFSCDNPECQISNYFLSFLQIKAFFFP